MKVHILYEFKEGPWGGGNQFLKALKAELENLGVYTPSLKEADVIMLSNYPTEKEEFFLQALKQKIKRNAKIVYRLDGLFHQNRETGLNSSDAQRDYLCKEYINNFCDGVIYQTDWIREIQQEFGVKKEILSANILNAPHHTIFNPQKLPKKEDKLKVIATCWAAHKRKGFETYQWLDENLDFSKIEFTFVGNTPVNFKNIIHKNPMNSKNLAKELTSHHVFLSAAYNEPCSNSLIEAIHIGLTPIGHKSGGTPEIIKFTKGNVFNSKEEALTLLNDINKNFQPHENTLPNIKEIAHQYLTFFEKVHKQNPQEKIQAVHIKRFKKTLYKNMDSPIIRTIKNILRPIKKKFLG